MKQLTRTEISKILNAAIPEDALSKKRMKEIECYIRKLEQALEEIATGEIVGEKFNYKDTVFIIKQIATEALN